MKLSKYILSWVVLTVLLLSAVVFTDLAMGFFGSSQPAVSAIAYPTRDMLLGVLSESARALLICYLFLQLKGAGSSYTYAIRFGLVISALIGTMWLIIGYGSFSLKDPNRFVLYDGSILFLQGILSGVVLQYFYSKDLLSPSGSSHISNGS